MNKFLSSNKEMDPLKVIESLRQVERVESPPFLLTRIHARLEQELQEVRPILVWVSICAILLLSIVNYESMRNIRKQSVNVDSEISGNQFYE